MEEHTPSIGHHTATKRQRLDEDDHRDDECNMNRHLDIKPPPCRDKLDILQKKLEKTQLELTCTSNHLIIMRNEKELELINYHSSYENIISCMESKIKIQNTVVSALQQVYCGSSNSNPITSTSSDALEHYQFRIKLEKNVVNLPNSF